MNRETHNTEYKQAWHDDHLKTVCAFANSYGGTLYLGKDDEGNAKGLIHAKKYLEEIPNKIKDLLGFIPEIRHKKENGKEIITIKIKPQKSHV
jgi:ATP-dependent DNA helicase RecG